MEKLPAHVQRQAYIAYQFFEEDHRHPSLNFKRVGNNLYSARVGRSYRAMATVESGDLVWFWIGTHADYDKLLNK